MSQNDPSKYLFLADSGASADLPPLYSNFVGVHENEDEIMLAFCIRSANPISAGGELLGIDMHTRIFLPVSAAKRLYQCFHRMYGED